MTSEERSFSDAFKRKINRRLELIKSRGNFNEIYRNEKMFDKKTFRNLISYSLAKTKSTDIPTEFRAYANFLQKYEKEDPGKFYIARTFGQHI